ncbi:MAG TPA: pyruvate, phosphate dikinase [Methanoculleus sp.]|nr:pyruvate, phosphate dikinase [Methanoculleus sp.]
MEKSIQRIVTFGHGSTDAVPARYFGTKAAGLATMASLGIPVPPGFSLSAEICAEYHRNGKILPDDTLQFLREGIVFLEDATGRKFGDERDPLILSVRSGAPVSMPGIMDTILNVGLNRKTVRGLIAMTGNPRFSWDSYRRFLENFGVIVFGHDPSAYRDRLAAIMAEEHLEDEVELDSSSLRMLAESYEKNFSGFSRRSFPENTDEQLELATIAVLDSWVSPRAELFRNIHALEDVAGTAVTVQVMVFGNTGARSGAGVGFTRNPWTGEKEFLVDFKFGAQGEDVVSGEQSAATQTELEAALPDAYRELKEVGDKLEAYYRDMQDIEFTIQDSSLYLLQSRSGKRAPFAALRIAVDMWREGLIPSQRALQLLEGVDLDKIVVQKIATDESPVTHCISASTGVAWGRIAFSSKYAEKLAAGGQVILVKDTITPDDLAGIDAAAGILTARGARTSHAAVVARQMGKVCIVNCEDLEIDPYNHRCRVRDRVFSEGDTITLDGDHGRIYEGKVDIAFERPAELLAIADRWKRDLANTVS